MGEVPVGAVAPVQDGTSTVAAPEQQKPEWMTFIPKEGRYGSIIKDSLESARDFSKFEGVDRGMLTDYYTRVDWEKYEQQPLLTDEKLLGNFRKARWLLTRMWISPDNPHTVEYPSFKSADEVNRAINDVGFLIGPFFKTVK